MFTHDFLEKFNAINVKFSQKNKERGYDFNTEAMYSTLKLGEEFGELSEQVLSALGHQRQSKINSYNKENLETEIADIIIQTLVVAAHFDVDVSQAVSRKIDILNEKISDY
ncbi:MAG: hypothetical protein MRY57_02430 [Candidatus Pacebacteria bacterium]|nr:hypothetical protein [Candidatus Paceibacterota bacterium]